MLRLATAGFSSHHSKSIGKKAAVLHQLQQWMVVLLLWTWLFLTAERKIYICSVWCLECKTGENCAFLILSGIRDIDGATKLVLLSWLHSHEYINWKLAFPSNICPPHITFVGVSFRNISSKHIIGNFFYKR